MTKEEIKPIGDYIFENIPPEKRFQTNDGMYIHYSDVCTLLNKHSADLTAENTRLREALERYEKVSEMIITTPSKNTATKDDLRQWQYTCIQMLESIKPDNSK